MPVFLMPNTALGSLGRTSEFRKGTDETLENVYSPNSH